MALSMRQEELKQVPWFSLEEWHRVYKQIYSDDVEEQLKGYLMLLAWKARIPKLPVGADCTLSIMQVCLRDREWTPKINSGELSISYENDLCLMYSTTIMRLLNHISNIGHTKQTSMFQIAKQLNIPEWIVNLRHDTAHGYELPSIGVLRIAVNILLAWLHEQYWAAEAKIMEENLLKDENAKEAQENDDVQGFSDLIELWTAVSLYIHAGYNLVSSVPDCQLKETLQDLKTYAISLLEDDNNENVESDKDDCRTFETNDIKKDKKYTLETARIVLLSEISRYLSKKSIPNKKSIVCDTLCNSEAFLPNDDILLIFAGEGNTQNELEKVTLPLNMMRFWKDIVFLLYEKDIMETMILKLLQLINNEGINAHKRELASLWLNSLLYSFLKLDAAHGKSRLLEYQFQKAGKRLLPKDFERKVQNETNRLYPHLKHVLWFNLSCIVLPCLADIKFLLKVVLNVNKYSNKLIPPLLELVSSKINKERKELLLSIVSTYIMEETRDKSLDKNSEKIFTLNDLQKEENASIINGEESDKENKIPRSSTNQTIRNNYWKIAASMCNWSKSPIGILPWQNDAIEILSPVTSIVQEHGITVLDSEIIPGIVDKSNINMQSQVNWDAVLRKKKKLKRRQEHKKQGVLINKALEAVKGQT